MTNLMTEKPQYYIQMAGKGGATIAHWVVANSKMWGFTDTPEGQMFFAPMGTFHTKGLKSITEDEYIKAWKSAARKVYICRPWVPGQYPIKPAIYICGPITGMPHLNRPAFTRAQRKLEKMGYTVYNPHELHEGATDMSWQGYMKRDIPFLIKADGVLLLPGWAQSTGASIEHNLCVQLAITLYHHLNEVPKL